MKTLRTILFFAACCLTQARAEPVFYHATSGRTDLSQAGIYPMRRGDVLEQPFTPNLDRIDVLDLGFDVGSGGTIGVIIRQGDNTNGFVIASQILQAPLTGEFGRRRMTFTPPVTVVPGTPHLLQLVAAPRPDLGVIIYGFLSDGEVSPSQRARFNGQLAYSDIDYGFGVLIPGILPAEREPAIYHEQDPPLALFPDAVITNYFFSGPAQILITISNYFFPGIIYVESSTNTFDHVLREWTSEPTNHPYHATHHIELAHNTSPARVQEVLRRVRFRNFTDVLDTRLETLSITYSNSWGTSHALAQLQTIAENDPPIPALDIYRTTTIFPDTNLYVISPRAKRPATVYFDLTPSNDPDHGSDFLIFTHAQDPGWETDRSTFRELRPGRHQFTLTAYDNDYTNTITRDLAEITAGRALQLWKRGVRATVTDRRDRAAVLRPLNAAQDSYARGQLRAMFGHLDRFFSIALERDVTVYTSWVDTYHAMGEVLFP